MRTGREAFILWCCISVACLTGLAYGQGGQCPSEPSGTIYPEIPPCHYFVRPCEEIEVAINLKDLSHRINLVQATINYGGKTCDQDKPVSLFCAAKVKPAWPLWADLQYSKCTDTSTTFIMGLLPPEFKAIGTIADNPVATISLTACEQDGRATISLSNATGKIVDGCLAPCACPSDLHLTPAWPVEVYVDGTRPVISIVSIRHENDDKCGELMLGCCPCEDCPPTSQNPCCPPQSPDNGCCAPGSCSTFACAGPGKVWIEVEAIDLCSGIKRPSVQVITACGTLKDITYTGEPVANTNRWRFYFEVKDDAEAGLATVLATVSDRCGNLSQTAEASFQICPVLVVSGLVELEDFVGSIREVHFTVCAKVNDEEKTFHWIRALKFERMEGYCYRVGAYELKIPGVKVCDIRYICVKTAWNLSRKHEVEAKDYCCGHLVVNFTGQKWLLAGDIFACEPLCCSEWPPRLGDDLIDMDDLFIVNAAIGDVRNYYNYWADVNGDGIVTESDLSLILRNFYREGAGEICCGCQEKPQTPQ